MSVKGKIRMAVFGCAFFAVGIGASDSNSMAEITACLGLVTCGFFIERCLQKL